MPRYGDEADAQMRKRVHDAIQTMTEAGDGLEDAVLVNWVVVADWSASDGERFFSQTCGGAGGEDSPPPWVEKGLLYHGLSDDGYEESEEG